MPVLDGPWWQVAGNPDLGEYTRPNQQPVDFGVWQAADGTWQLWSCIRHTGCGGNTRLFYRWEGRHLTDEHWKPMRYRLLASGGRDASHLYVALVDAATGREIVRVTGDNHNAFHTHRVDASGAPVRRAFVRIVDAATGPWGHINFGGLYEDALDAYFD